MIEGSTCDDLSFSAPKLVTPEGHALPSHRQRVGENRRRAAAFWRIAAVAINAPKKGCICTHSRALPRDDHHLLGVHKARSSAQGPRQLSASSTGSRRRWDRFVELMARSNALESGFRSPARRHVPATCAPELGRARRRNVVAAPRGPTLRTPRRPSHARTMV
jgi:hypothetical protein